VDCVGLTNGQTPDCTTTEYLYCGTIVGPDGTFTPGHVYRCPSGWLIGLFDPSSGNDTAGTANDCTVGVEQLPWGQVKTLFR
jgi:hypothetical protein